MDAKDICVYLWTYTILRRINGGIWLLQWSTLIVLNLCNMLQLLDQIRK